MIDDDVISRLVELHDHIKAPDTSPGADVSRGERMLRRRRAVVLGAASAAVVAVLGVTAVTIGGQAGDRIEPTRPGPTQDFTPTPSETSSTVGDWPLERIRAEGILEEESVTESGITVRMYAACGGPESVCGPRIDPPIRREHTRFALEVAQGGRSALFSVNGEWPHVVTPYRNDALIILDGAPGVGVDPADPSNGRHRLLRADGTERLLRLEDDPAPADPGPGVVVIDRARYEGEGKAAMQFAFHFDEPAGTLQLLDVPPNTDMGVVGNSWGPNTDEALWLVQAIDCRVHRVVGASVEQYDACGDFKGRWYDSLVSVNASWIPDGWLTPERMAVLQDTRGRLTLHVSLDQGATWRHIPVRDRAAIPDALQRLG
jgi:hypothetical protein